jgi:FkbM family methyltransferase
MLGGDSPALTGPDGRSGTQSNRRLTLQRPFAGARPKSVLRHVIQTAVERILHARIVRPQFIGLLFEQEHLRRLFNEFRIDCVFDVGAHEGEYAEMIRAHADFTGTIISYEPVPQAAQVLRQKAARDHAWFVEQIALDESPGTKPFNVAADTQFSSFHAPDNSDLAIFAAKNSVSQVIEVEASTLQLQYEKYRRMLDFKRPFLKLDTQGHDCAIIAGASAALSKFVGLQSELSVRQIYEGAPAMSKALAYLQDRGFVPSALVPNNAGHFPILVEIDCIMINAGALVPATGTLAHWL